MLHISNKRCRCTEHYHRCLKHRKAVHKAMEIYLTIEDEWLDVLAVSESWIPTKWNHLCFMSSMHLAQMNNEEEDSLSSIVTT